MTLSEPFWLVLVIPLALTMWLWPLPSRLMMVLRGLALVALLGALCGLGVRLPSRTGTIVVVADRSLSMPPTAAAAQKEAADILHAAMSGDNNLAVVSFAQVAAIEQAPGRNKISGFISQVGPDASNLAEGMDLALSLIGDSPGRILLLSDGRWTGRDVSAAAARSAAAAVSVDYRLLERSVAGDLAVSRIEGPAAVAPGEAFMITAWVEAPRAGAVTYELCRGESVIAAGTQEMSAGLNRLMFRDRVESGGTCEYALRVSSAAPDAVPENNAARLLVGVSGPRRILCVSPSAAAGLTGALAKAGLDIDRRNPDKCRWSLEELSSCSAVVLENTPASSLGHHGMETLAAWVSQAGGGLMLTGGRSSYGPGGYFKSPLDPILPVSMELRQEHRKLSLAIVVVLDRSGSMSVSVPGGRIKMDLANLGTCEVLNLLGPMDQFACFAVDSSAHEIVPLQAVVDKPAMTNAVSRIGSEGGGIFVYEGLAAAVKTIAGATAGTKHIVLFADAADSEEPGDYKTLIEKCTKAGITISVIGLGTEKDCDAELLKDIARRGGGQCMFTNEATELPRLFAQDTLLVARNSFLDQPVAVKTAGGMLSIRPQPLGALPDIGGYNLCYTRPGATLAAYTLDEYKAPFVASWQAGLGRVLCYTGEADGKYTGPLGRWDSAGEFFASLARWTAGQSQGLGTEMLATQELINGACRVQLHLNPQRKATPFSTLPQLTVLAGLSGQSLSSRTVRLNWSSADTLSADIPISGRQTVLATLDVPGVGRATLPPACLPYSPEYAPPRPGQGGAALERLARATGGIERTDLAGAWNDIPRRPRMVAMQSYLLIAAALLFLLEVLQRRTGLLGALWPAGRKPESASAPIGKSPPTKAAKRIKIPKQRRDADKADAPEPPAPPAPEPAPPPPATISSAFDEARRRAGGRTDRR